MAEHQGKLVELPNRIHRAECGCGWAGAPYYGRGTAAREHDEHLRDVAKAAAEEED